DEQLAILRKWIEQGAEYEGHWAFLPLGKGEPPAVKNTAWVRNPIDRFILSRLEQEGLQPSPEADRATLIRRVSLDLTGLLPAPEEVRAFVEDSAPDAYGKLVERLLASPHYGERWGRHWLDQARYADSNGYSIDRERQMWPYRDWVIQALNTDQPFDRFTIEQLAGDLLPQPANSQLVATAFHRNTLINEEGGVDKEQFRVEAVIDRVNTTAAVWLGLTVGCAQCHTHKFDPITHREYYELLAFFNQGQDVNDKGATITVAPGEMFGEIVAPPKPVPPPPDLGALQAAWEKQQLARLTKTAPRAAQPVQWTPARYLEYDTSTGAGFQLLPDNSLLSDGRGAFNDTYRVLADTSLRQVAAVRLRVLTHESLPRRGPGSASNGNFVLTEFTVSVGGEKVPIVRAFGDHEQPGYAVSATIDGDAGTGWAINVVKDASTKMNADHEALFVFERPIAPGDRPLEFKLHHDLNEKYLVGRFALEFAETAPAPPAEGNAALLAALKTPARERSDADKKLVREAFARAEPRARPDPKRDQGGLMVMKETDKPRPTFLFERGDFLRPDTRLGPLQPAVLSAVAPALPPSEKRTRLDLAKWLVSPDNPLTPRVTMNRAWMRYFGRGLVETEEDFGTQGLAPTHPELLDWLAGKFIRRGWSMKAMHSLIVSSATYRQSSKARPDLAEKDPRNLLLARQERLRVDAEIVRDAALSASGLLTRTIGGPSVRPPQPEGVYAFTQNVKEWKPDTGPNRFRRTLYTMFYRSAPYPLFTTFDAPDFQSACTRRVRSNTPLQALTVANDAAFIEIAQGLAGRVLREISGSDDEGTIDARLRRAFALTLSRAPSAKELELLRGYYTRQVESFAGDLAGAKALASSELAQSTPQPEIAAAMVCVARTLFNTDNFITRE
ncbi:MAG: DUF1549 and DUF1553 domain-containing protein, partial [Verrucomicrobiota bacterium]|nr:DUF1549 and DUF1553 domain-containing protein [Verrucomicrobiota bacterium]